MFVATLKMSGEPNTHHLVVNYKNMILVKALPAFDVVKLNSDRVSLGSIRSS